MLKKFKTLILAVLMILPMMFVFTACGKDDSASNPPSVQQPATPDYTQDNYKIVIDYSLPQKLEMILQNTEVTSVIDKSYDLPVFDGTNLDKYFDGWYYKSDNKKVESSSIKGSKNEVINIYANWKDEILDTYYTDGLNFAVNQNTKTATVTGYTGTSSIIVIPKTYVEDGQVCSVDAIQGKDNELSDVKEVIVLGDSIKVLKNSFIDSSIEKFDFSAVEVIEDFAFSGSKICEAIFSDNLKSIERNAFANCGELKKVDFSNTTSDFFIIQNSLFENCSNLTYVEFSDNISILKESAFKNCISLADISFINNLQTIERESFYGCNLIKEITLSDSINTIGLNVFDGINSKIDLKLAKLFTDTHQYLRELFGESISSVEKITLIGEDIDIIYRNYFSDCVGLTDFVMSNSVVEVQEYAFARCDKLINIEFSQNIIGDRFNANSVEDTAFYKECDELLVINNIVLLVTKGLPETLGASDFKGATSISREAFKDNNSIKKITLPSSLKVIGEGAFESCKNLSEVIFEDGSELVSVGERAFYDCNNLSCINLDACISLETISDYAFYRCGNLGVLKLPSSIEALGDSCFGFTNVSSFEIDGVNQNYVTESGVLYQVNNGAKVSIYAYPIANDEKVFIVPETVTTINQAAFASNNLEYVYISSSINFEVDSFLYSAAIIMLEDDDFEMPLNNSWSKYIYTMFELEEGDYSISDGEISLDILFDETVNGRHFSYIVDGAEKYCILFDVIDGKINNLRDVSSIFLK